jgi:hypothetical protein
VILSRFRVAREVSGPIGSVFDRRVSHTLGDERLKSRVGPSGQRSVSQTLITWTKLNSENAQFRASILRFAQR